MPYSYLDLLLGNHAGALGETCVLTLLIGYIFLLAVRVVDAWATLPFIGMVAVVSAFAGQDVVYQLLSGGLAMGAFFMATDYTTTPMNPLGKVVFGLCCGLITGLVRFFASSRRASAAAKASRPAKFAPATTPPHTRAATSRMTNE